MLDYSAGEKKSSTNSQTKRRNKSDASEHYLQDVFVLIWSLLDTNS